MREKLQNIKAITTQSLKEVKELKALDEFRVKMLGKKGELTQLLKGMGKLDAKERPIVGQMVNEVREFVEQSLESTKSKLLKAEQNLRVQLETIDVTCPGTKTALGHKHPLTTTTDELKQFFIGMGYEIAEGPDVETDYYNFEALNIPADHPAKDEQDTFYVEGGFLLRSQTSSVQVHAMEEAVSKNKFPIRIIAPGRVYRSDEVDATHSPVFHQLEGLVVDKGISMGDLKGSLALFAKHIFGEGVKIRFRPHHFQFTEPSAEMDISCFACGGVGCRVCKQTGFIEILGCGMVHPKVLKMSGIDPTVYSGFAFGMGIERIAMQRFGITDMRIMYENDIKFLKQF